MFGIRMCKMEESEPAAEQPQTQGLLKLNDAADQTGGDDYDDLDDLMSPMENKNKTSLRERMNAAQQVKAAAQSKLNEIAQQQTQAAEEEAAEEELDSLISAFASPISDKIYMGVDTKQKHKKDTMAQIQESPLEHEAEGELKGTVFREFTIHIFQSISFLQTLKISDEDINARAIEFKFKKPGFKKLIIFDLDETLAHCVRKPRPQRRPDVFLDITTPSGKVLKAGFNIRPYCKEMLEASNKHYEVAVFTASNQEYADTILDYIDPTGKLIQHRFYRPQCIKTTDSVYVKDLRIFKNVPLKDIIIVDNAVYSFGAQLENGIPITPFEEDKEDFEFKNLITYIERLASYDDLSKANEASFQLGSIYKYDFERFIDYYDYEDCEKLMKEEEEEAEEISQDQGQDARQNSGKKGRRASNSPTLRKQNNPPKQVSICLDALSKIMKFNKGSLPL